MLFVTFLAAACFAAVNAAYDYVVIGGGAG